MTDLAALIERARGASVDRTEAERYVRELERWARPVPQPRRWSSWLVPAVAAAAAVAVVVLWLGQSAPVAARLPIQIGDRVAIVAASGTAYRVVHADRDASEIAIERGTVTARLWPGRTPHRLVLAGGGVTATATGTIYSLTVGAAGLVVAVAEGRVEVRAADGLHAVSAGASWPTATSITDRAAVDVLRAIPPPAILAAASSVGEPAEATLGAGSEAEVGSDAAAEVDAGVASPGSGSAPAAPAPIAHRPAPTPIKDRWRAARLLRAQGRFADALSECLGIANAQDPMWSPIALVEAVRIELGPLADPERAIALVDRMVSEWPRHALVSEARALRCRALGELGRDAECNAALAP
jgi:hypothetical protein